MALTSGGNQAEIKNARALFPVWLKAVLCDQNFNDSPLYVSIIP